MRHITIEQAITQCDELKPNSYSTAQKKKWLSEIDGLVWDEIIVTHQSCPLFYKVICNGKTYRRVKVFNKYYIEDERDPREGDASLEKNDNGTLDFYVYTNGEWVNQAEYEPEIMFTGFRDYDENDDGDTELLVPTPYDSIYTYYLHMQIDKANNDQRYENSAANFSNAYQSFAAAYNRTHLPLQRGQWFKFLRR